MHEKVTLHRIPSLWKKKLGKYKKQDDFKQIGGGVSPTIHHVRAIEKQMGFSLAPFADDIIDMMKGFAASVRSGKPVKGLKYPEVQTRLPRAIAEFTPEQFGAWYTAITVRPLRERIIKSALQSKIGTKTDKTVQTFADMLGGLRARIDTPSIDPTAGAFEGFVAAKQLRIKQEQKLRDAERALRDKGLTPDYVRERFYSEKLGRYIDTQEHEPHLLHTSIKVGERQPGQSYPGEWTWDFNYQKQLVTDWRYMVALQGKYKWNINFKGATVLTAEGKPATILVGVAPNLTRPAPKIDWYGGYAAIPEGTPSSYLDPAISPAFPKEVTWRWDIIGTAKGTPYLSRPTQVTRIYDKATDTFVDKPDTDLIPEYSPARLPYWSQTPGQKIGAFVGVDLKMLEFRSKQILRESLPQRKIVDSYLVFSPAFPQEIGVIKGGLETPGLWSKIWRDAQKQSKSKKPSTALVFKLFGKELKSEVQKIIKDTDISGLSLDSPMVSGRSAQVTRLRGLGDAISHIRRISDIEFLIKRGTPIGQDIVFSSEKKLMRGDALMFVNERREHCAPTS